MAERLNAQQLNEKRVLDALGITNDGKLFLPEHGVQVTSTHEGNRIEVTLVGWVDNATINTVFDQVIVSEGD